MVAVAVVVMVVCVCVWGGTLFFFFSFVVRSSIACFFLFRSVVSWCRPVFFCVRSCVAGDAYLVIVSGLLRPVCVGHCVCSSFVLSAVDCCCFRIVPVCMRGMFNYGCHVFTFGLVFFSKFVLCLVPVVLRVFVCPWHG